MYTLLVTGDVPGAATYFNPLLQQSIIPCTSGTRPSSPNDGMMAWETDTERYTSYNATLGAWVTLAQMLTGTYTATLTASTTNPTLGTGGAAEGRYALFAGKWCAIRGTVKFGTSGTSAGSGQYFIALPFTSNSSISNGVSTCGSGIVRSAGSLSVVGYYCTPSATSMAGVTVGGSNITSGTPGAWTTNDYLSFSMVFETA